MYLGRTRFPPRTVVGQRIEDKWSKLLGNMLGSKATTGQKVSRNQHDESKVYSVAQLMIKPYCS